jgi:hypothetical protein
VVILKLNDPCFFEYSLGRNPIRSRKSFKDRPTSVYSGKSSGSVEENPSSLPVGEFQSDGGFYYDLDGNVQSEEHDTTLMDSCGNIPAVRQQEISRLDLAGDHSHSFA